MTARSLATSDPSAAPHAGVVIESRDRNLLIDGIVVHRGGIDSAVESIEKLTTSGRATLVITPNVDQVLNLAGDQDFRLIFRTADLLLVDGTPVVWLGRILGARDLHRVTGADLLPRAVELLGAKGHRIAIVGGDRRNGVAAAAALMQKSPGATVRHIPVPIVQDVGSHDLTGVVEALREFQPSIAFVCLGSPKQEKWMDAWRLDLPPAVYVGAGAAADFAAAAVTRAPALVQRIGLEWAWRLAQEPKRLWKRYLWKGPRFGRVVWASWTAHMKRRAARNSR